MKVLYDTILKAKYTGRPNRFVVTLDLNGESVRRSFAKSWSHVGALVHRCNDVHRAS